MIALGDSFVEGRGDERDGRFHGWVPKFAGQLGLPPAQIMNLGAHGVTTARVIDEQLDRAVDHLRGPGVPARLVGVVVGVNDLISDYDAARFDRNLRTILGALNGAGAVVFTASYPDIPARLPVPDGFRSLLRQRFAEANRSLASIADQTGTAVLDLAVDPAWARDDMWSVDGLHPSARGHSLFACRAVDLVSTRTGTIAA